MHHCTGRQLTLSACFNILGTILNDMALVFCVLLSVGLESIEDLVKDLEQALAKV